MAKIDVINAAVHSGFYDVVLVAFNFTMSDNKPLLDALQNAATKRVGLIAMKTQAGGLLGTRFVPTQSEDESRKEWQRLQREKETDMSGTPLRSNGCCRTKSITTAIPGVTKYEQIELDFSVASNLEYTPEEKTIPRRQEPQGQAGVLPAMRRVRSHLPAARGHSHADADSHVRASVRKQLSGAVNFGAGARGERPGRVPSLPRSAPPPAPRP